jgi:hypothetical protein
MIKLKKNKKSKENKNHIRLWNKNTKKRTKNFHYMIKIRKLAYCQLVKELSQPNSLSC